MRFLKRYACFWFLLCFAFMAKCQSLSESQVIFSTENPSPALGDTTALFTIKDISIIGNKRTRTVTIFRELPFQVGEKYPLNTIVDKFYVTKKQLMNTGLFRNVVVSLKSLNAYDVYVNIEVEEKWYIYPLPFVHLVNDNFHKWWTEDNKRLDYLKYGIRITQNNVTGRNDKLFVNFQEGYTKEVSMQYQGLYLDKALKWYSSLGLAFGKNREVNYKTAHDKQVPLSDRDNYIHSYYNAYLSFTYRKAIKTRHTFRFGFYHEDVSDTIFKLNPSFSPVKQGTHAINYPELSYNLSYYDVDFIPYPTKGYAAEFSLAKKGFNDPINLWQFTAKGSGTWTLPKKYFFNVRAVGMLKLPLKQPYITQSFIGFNDLFLQGYEYYIIDGAAGGYTKFTLAKNILNSYIRIPEIRIKKISDIPVSRIPIKLYLKAFVNAGYVYNPTPGDNILPNKMLYSSGIGLDIVTFTDFVIKLEWSFNALGQNNIYLHRLEYY